MRFQQETKGIYRLKIPFEDLYTSVFLIQTRQCNVLVDCGTCANDVDKHIIPAIESLGLNLKDINYLVLTHSHSDHTGGLSRILELNAMMQVVNSIMSICVDGITIYEMKGHTLDCIGVLDERSGSLISGDGLQGHGIGKYRCSLENKNEYIKTIEKIRKDERIKNILFSHDYEPWYKDGVFGRVEVESCLNDCIEYIEGR